MKQELDRLQKENKELRKQLSKASSYVDRFHMIVDNSYEWVWEVNSSGVYTYVSPQVEKVLGYTPEELIGKTPFDLMSEEEAHRVLNEFSEIVLAKRSFSKLVNKCLHKNGDELYAETSGEPFYDDDGVFLGYRGIDFDRTKETINTLELKSKTISLEKALLEQYYLTRNVMNSISDIIFYKDTHYRYIGCNQAFCNFLGLEMNDILGKTDFDLFAHEYAEHFRLKDIEIIQSMNTQSNYEWVSDCRANNFYFLTQKSPLIDENGELIGMVGISKDYTLNHQLEEKLEKSHQKYKTLASELDLRVQEQSAQLIKQSQMAKMGELLSMIAHQWRQPLSAIASVAINIKFKLELARLNPYDEEKNEAFHLYIDKHMNEIETYVASLSTTIDDFRTLYITDKVKVVHSIVKPIEEALLLIKRSFNESHITVEKYYGTQNCVEIHKGEVMQVILNLLKNAEDNFLERKIQNPKIKITTTELDGYLKVDISDNGGGISKSIKDKIFFPYFSTKGNKNGTGLGLYMCKIIIEEHHNGRVNLCNTDEGACFSIELPYTLKNSFI